MSGARSGPISTASASPCITEANEARELPGAAEDIGAPVAEPIHRAPVRMPTEPIASIWKFMTSPLGSGGISPLERKGSRKENNTWVSRTFYLRILADFSKNLEFQVFLFEIIGWI